MSGTTFRPLPPLPRPSCSSNTACPQSEHRDLEELSQLGHFLKGSSATLGLTKVKESCEKIQNYGKLKDESGIEEEPDEDVCLDRIRQTLPVLTKDYNKAEQMLREYYEPQKSERS